MNPLRKLGGASVFTGLATDATSIIGGRLGLIDSAGNRNRVYNNQSTFGNQFLDLVSDC